MSRDYYIKLNALEAPDAQYPDIAVGSVSPVTRTEVDDYDVSFAEAMAASTLPFNVGIWAASKADQALRAFSQEDNQRNKDPSFDPFTVWKENEHSPDDINSIMDMDNWDQYYLYREIKSYQGDVAQTISDAGPVGNAASVLSYIFTDPTTYMGFGVAGMLGKGMAAKKAYAIGSAGAVAASETITQGIDQYDERSVSESLFNIGAGAVIGGVLGSAVDVWSGRSVLAKKGKDFNQASAQYLQDANDVEQRFARSVGLDIDETVKYSDPLEGLEKEFSDPVKRRIHLINWLEKEGARREAAGSKAGMFQDDLDRKLARIIDEDQKSLPDAVKQALIQEVSLDQESPIGETVNAGLERITGTHIFNLRQVRENDMLAQSVGAAVTDPAALAASIAESNKKSEVLGFAARKGARGLRLLSPKLFGQSSAVPEVREAFEKVFGRNLKTIGDEAGIARKVSIVEEATNIESRAIGKIAQYNDEMKKLATEGHYLDEAAEAEAILLASNGRFNLKSQPKSVSRAAYEMAKKYRDYFGDFSKRLEESGIEGYTTRNGYGAPLIFNASKVNRNIPKMTQIIYNGLEKMQKSAGREIQRLEKTMAQRKNSGLDYTEVKNEIRDLKEFAETETIYLQQDAERAVNRFAAGQGWESFNDTQAAKLIPKRFRARMYDFENVIEFVETDPNKLMGGYAREVAPFMASQKVLGEKTPYKLIDDLVDKGLEEARRLEAAGDLKGAEKIKKEIIKAEKSLKTGWETSTGERAQKLRDVMHNDLINWLNASKSIVAITKLGNRVSASISDVNGILLHHHLKGFGGFLNTAQKMALSPELREMSKNQARIMGISMEHSKNTLLHDNLSDALHNAEIGGTGFSGQVAESLRWSSAKFEKINGGVYWDTATRRTMMIAQQGLLKDSMEGLLKGSIHKNSATDLAFLGLDKDISSLILKQMDEFGETVDGVFFGHPEKWTDKKAADAWILALQRDGRRTSIQPGIGDTPHFFTVPGVSNLVQFKSWSVTATQVYGLSALQRADAQHMIGIVSLVGMATAADIFDQWSRGNKIHTDPEELLWAGINKSGLLGVTPELGGAYLMNKVFDIESGGARLYDYATLGDVVLGPSLGVVQDIGGVAKPLGGLLSADEDMRFNDAWAKHLIDLVPAPFVKPYIKNAIGNDN
jgi:hypothetical protein